MTNEALDIAFRRLDSLDLSAIQSSGDWGLGRMFSHLAQGVEFSMSGYPEERSRLFQMSAGKLAFTIFKLRGRMRHGLAEPIPGEVVGDVPAEEGLQRLWTSLEQFRDFRDPLRPHFTFGPLDRDQFAVAHLMHIENHLEQVRIA
ncbi:DUF1569 domain-containing protein [Hasllibacter sp. MH4015]|uniref:DUF1569 domain-containing protein n=1 Tax=Hasllibacter sp. MH4015 TaxID=2854029 RepID=UPI001CD7CD2A|nr:DUF1569 domain-containing protein [Hasllibacter sp. MH4015]